MALPTYGPTWAGGAPRRTGGRAWKSVPLAKRYRAPVRRYVTPAAAPEAAPAAPAGLTPEARGAFGEAIEQYRPGGGFGAGVEAALGRGRTKAVASGMQSLVSSGLAGTTMAAGLGKKYEEEVGAPTRAGVESERARMISNLKLQLAMAEQGAFEAGAGRGLGYAQLGAQTGLGYAQLGVSERASTGQLGLGYTQVGAGREAARGQLGLGYAQLTSRNQPVQQVPTVSQQIYSRPGLNL